MRSGKGLLALILILCSRFAKVTCADLVGTFTYPVENGLIFYNGETIDVSWTSTLSNASLYLFCRYEIDSVWNTKPISNIGLVDSNGSKKVYVEVAKSSNYCWFNLFKTGDNSDGVNSVTFLISSDVHSGTIIGLSDVATTSYAVFGVPTGPVTAATTAAAGTSTSTSTSTATATAIKTDITSNAAISTTENSSTNPDTASSGQSSRDLSTTAKAGIGAGVGVASLMVIGAFIIWFLRRKRRDGQVFYEGQRGTSTEKNMLVDVARIGATKGGTWQPGTIHEMRDNQRPFELHASTGPHNGHRAELDG